MTRLICTVILLLCLSVPGMADPGVQVDQNAGFIDLATHTFGIGTSTAANIGLNVPAGCRGFELTVFGGDCVVGPLADISTGPLWVGHKIASGTSMTFESHEYGAATFSCYGKMMGATVGTGTLVAW